MILAQGPTASSIAQQLETGHELSLRNTSIAQQKFVPGFSALAQYFKQLGVGKNNRGRIFAQLY